jgi:foldase protein PrsA
MRDGYRKGFLGIMAMVCAAAMISCGTPSIEDSDTVMEIAGQPVVKAEYQMVLKHYAPEVKRQYSTEEANAENFWEMEEGRPLERVMELAEEDLTRKKVVARLAGEAGIGEKADYLSIMEGMGAENTEREGKVSSGEVVYGLTSFAPEDYYSYVYTSLESQLLEKLKSSHPISDEELEEIYQENQGQYTSEVRVHMLVGEMQPEADGAGGRQAEQSQSEAGMETAQQVKDSMEGGAEIDVLTEQYPQVNFYEIEMSSFQTEEGKSGVYAQRWLTASSMEENQVCEPFFIGGNLMVMRCLSREENVAEPLDEIKGLLKSEVQTRMAQEDIEKGVREAEITFRQKELKQAAQEALADI